jgi:hypothetical protein
MQTLVSKRGLHQSQLARECTDSHFGSPGLVELRDVVVVSITVDENVVLGLQDRRLHRHQCGGQSCLGENGDAERASKGGLDGVSRQLGVALSCEGNNEEAQNGISNAEIGGKYLPLPSLLSNWENQ